MEDPIFMKAIIDCNSFYCSCERLFKPHLDDKPVVVLDTKKIDEALQNTPVREVWGIGGQYAQKSVDM